MVFSFSFFLHHLLSSKTKKDFITYCAIFIIIFSLVYYGCVCVSEIAAGTDFMKWIQWNLCCYCCPDKDRIRLKNLRKRRLKGEIIDDPMDEFPIDTDLELAHNPMMHSAGNLKAQKEAEEKAKILELQLQQQNENNAKMAEMMRKNKKNSNSGTAVRKRKKKKGRMKKNEFGAVAVGSKKDPEDGGELEMSVFASNPLAQPNHERNQSNPLMSQHFNSSSSAGTKAATGTGTGTGTVPVSQIRNGYRRSLDEASGKHYYFNEETKETQWEKPDGW